MSWCEANGVDYVFGLARNARLRALIEPQMVTATLLEAETGKPARVFTEFLYKTTTGSWSRHRRVVAKAEHLQDKENPRYVVTSLSAQEWPAQKLYEELYCERGEMENRIKEQFSLFADRVSTEHLRSNQLGRYLSAMAYVLLHGLRRLGLKGTEWARAQAGTIRLRLLKNRRAGPHHSTEGMGFARQRLPLAQDVRSSLGEPPLLTRQGRRNKIPY